MFKKLREKTKNKKGFTLVELIVVIVIILVLAAVMVPSVLRYVEKANQANVRADAATILTQVQADAADALLTTGTYNPVGQDINGAKGIAWTANGMNTPTTGTGNTAEFMVDIDTTSATTATTYGEITGFAYRDGTYFINWSKDDGWGAPSKTATTP